MSGSVAVPISGRGMGRVYQRWPNLALRMDWNVVVFIFIVVIKGRSLYLSWRGVQGIAARGLERRLFHPKYCRWGRWFAIDHAWSSLEPMIRSVTAKRARSRESASSASDW